MLTAAWKLSRYPPTGDCIENSADVATTSVSARVGQHCSEYSGVSDEFRMNKRTNSVQTRRVLDSGIQRKLDRNRASELPNRLYRFFNPYLRRGKVSLRFYTRGKRNDVQRCVRKRAGRRAPEIFIRLPRGREYFFFFIGILSNCAICESYLPQRRVSSCMLYGM